MAFVITCMIMFVGLTIAAVVLGRDAFGNHQQDELIAKGNKAATH